MQVILYGALDSFAAFHPMARVGQAPGIADGVVFLASDQFSFITGQSIPIDGGWMAQ